MKTAPALHLPEQRPTSFRMDLRLQIEGLLPLMDAIVAFDLAQPLDEQPVDEWKKIAAVLDAALEMLEGDAGAGLLLCVRGLLPDLAPRFEALRDVAKDKARALLDRLEDEVLLDAWSKDDAGDAGALVPHDQVRRELALVPAAEKAA